MWSDVVAKVPTSSRFTTALLLLYYCFTTDYSDVVAKAPAEFPVVWMGSEDALFTLYTSGSTGTRS